METTLQHWQKSILMTLVHLVGDLGYFTEDEMVSAFSKAAFSLKIDEIYPEVVETSADII